MVLLLLSHAKYMAIMCHSDAVLCFLELLFCLVGEIRDAPPFLVDGTVLRVIVDYFQRYGNSTCIDFPFVSYRDALSGVIAAGGYGRHNEMLFRERETNMGLWLLQYC